MIMGSDTTSSHVLTATVICTPTRLQQIHRVSGFLVCFRLLFGAVQIYVLFRAAYALKNLLTRTAARLAEMMWRDNRKH